jgi:DNA-binding NarL/FixJ family response regulator
MMMPTELELAVLLGADAPVVREFESECGRIAHGQAWAAGNGRGIGQAMRELEAPEMKAAARLAARRRDAARSNRLRARMASLRAETTIQDRDRKILAAIAGGMTHAEIARATGLTRGRIGQIAMRNKETTT